MRLTHRIALAGIATAAASLGLASSAFAGSFGDISIARTVHFIGVGVTNTTGAGQTLTQRKTPPGVTRYFAMRIENFSGDGNYWVVDGCESTKKFKVKYFTEFSDGSFQDVTAGVAAGTQTTGLTDFGESAFLEMQIKPTGRAKPGSSFGCLVSKNSVPFDNEANDAVKGVVEVKG
jgi:hypothetical protein